MMKSASAWRQCRWNITNIIHTLWWLSDGSTASVRGKGHLMKTHWKPRQVQISPLGGTVGQSMNVWDSPCYWHPFTCRWRHCLLEAASPFSDGVLAVAAGGDVRPVLPQSVPVWEAVRSRWGPELKPLISLNQTDIKIRKKQSFIPMLLFFLHRLYLSNLQQFNSKSALWIRLCSKNYVNSEKYISCSHCVADHNRLNTP